MTAPHGKEEVGRAEIRLSSLARKWRATSLVPAVAELLSGAKKIPRFGVTLHRCVNQGVTTSMYNHDLDGDQVELLIDKFATNLEGIAYTRGRSANDKHSVGAVNRGAFGIPAGRPRRPARRARPL